MSSFMVADSTINRITSYVFDARPHLQRRLAAKKLPTDPNAFAWALICLNKLAVETRYEDRAKDLLTEDPYEYTPEDCTNEYQVLKSMACFLYQCSEGDVPDEPLYKFISEVRGDLAEEIVRNSPEYDEAEWG